MSANASCTRRRALRQSPDIVSLPLPNSRRHLARTSRSSPIPQGSPAELQSLAAGGLLVTCDRDKSLGVAGPVRKLVYRLSKQLQRAPGIAGLAVMPARLQQPGAAGLERARWMRRAACSQSSAAAAGAPRAEGVRRAGVERFGNRGVGFDSRSGKVTRASLGVIHELRDATCSSRRRRGVSLASAAAASSGCAKRT